MYPMEVNTSVFMSVSGVALGYTRQVDPGNTRRSRAHCLAECRRRTLAALCGCQLHTLPHDHRRFRTCSLADLPCLNKHREKLIYYYPGTSGDVALEEETQNGQDCSECGKETTRNQYSASISVARYFHSIQQKLFRRKITEGLSLINTTILRVYFSSEHQMLLTVEPNTRWYETFVSVGSTWAGITGASMVAACELVFYLTVRWSHHYVRRADMPRSPHRAEVTWQPRHVWNNAR